MDAVKRMVVGGGVSIPAAIKEALSQRSLTVVAFAEKYELPRASTNEVLNATRRPIDQVIEALARELGGDPVEWKWLLWQAAKPDEFGRPTVDRVPVPAGH